MNDIEEAHMHGQMNRTSSYFVFWFFDEKIEIHWMIFTNFFFQDQKTLRQHRVSKHKDLI